MEIIETLFYLLIGESLLLVIIGVLLFKAWSWVKYGLIMAFSKTAAAVIKVYKDGSVAIGMENLKGKQAINLFRKMDDSQVQIKSIWHRDAGTGRPLHVIIEETRENVNLLSRFQPDENNKNLNKLMQQHWVNGYQVAMRRMEEKNKLIMLILVVCIVITLAAMMGAYYSYMGYQASGQLGTITDQLRVIGETVKDLNMVQVVR